ncbi:ATP-dependent 6-phosphofructokinase [Pontiella sulfatireligans]|uniref:ATP-dependent 6-phosphofructokinase n=1 Tax=Pontiella sulfatireligans TaxID=2750658 RepID=A0A6C2UNH1_9BACT|nr:ATP-dependent 6-phosphofructokinase [Pontiella sulfatireligans]VGO21812.1 ATP-dependent 6-phosphofructokinase [Pontiella sulfatireligans]
MAEAKIIRADTLGEPNYDSPLKGQINRFYNGEAVACNDRTKDFADLESIDDIDYFELAGPREKLFFNPKNVTVGIVTCGGLCPGLNDVIRALTFCSLQSYGVKRVLGFKYGYEGLVAKYYHYPIELTTDNTDEIHEKGGTILKSSRGAQDTDEIINTLIHYGVDILFTIGGDGTQRGARDIVEGVKKRNLPIAVVGIPKTIDNDIDLIQRSFGFETAVEATWDIITNAHSEAKAYRNGVGLVNLMGRESGWIAASASLANSNVNFCLVPEVPFDLHGPNGFLQHLKTRLQNKEHAVVVVAEGAGQNLFDALLGTNKSGNKNLNDIGILLKNEINAYFKAENMEANVKYFDPSYNIRSRRANANDSMYCLRLGNNAVHAAMAGKTNMIVGLHHDRLIHLPIPMVGARKTIDPQSWFWQTVVQATHQPAQMANS